MINKIKNENLQPILLENSSGLSVQIIPYGAIIKDISFHGQSLTIGYDNPESYLNDPYYLGATIGRYANRICNGKFELNNQKIILNKDKTKHSLHGGVKGFNRVNWELISKSSTEINLFYRSEDGEEGYPGTLEVLQTIVIEENELKISYIAESSKDTIINLTNHTYFNLNNSRRNIENHELQLASEHYLPIDSDAIPTGEIKPVINSCFDFLAPKPLKASLTQKDPQIVIAKGIDHCFIAPENNNELKWLASLFSPESGRSVKLLTTQPSVQIYTGNYLSSPFEEKQAVCLEAQNWPDAPNKKHFPSATLKANETYRQEIHYTFG